MLQILHHIYLVLSHTFISPSSLLHFPFWDPPFKDTLWNYITMPRTPYAPPLLYFPLKHKFCLLADCLHPPHTHTLEYRFHEDRHTVILRVSNDSYDLLVMKEQENRNLYNSFKDFFLCKDFLKDKESPHPASKGRDLLILVSFSGPTTVPDK